MFKLLKAVVVQNGKATPIVAYIMQNLYTELLVVVDRQDAFELVSEYGSPNVEAKTRLVSCKEDLMSADENGVIYYLKVKEGHGKINQYIIESGTYKIDDTEITMNDGGILQ